MEWNAEEQQTYPTIIWILLVTFFIHLKEKQISIRKWVGACVWHAHAVSPFFICKLEPRLIIRGKCCAFTGHRDDKQVNESHTSFTFTLRFPSPCSCTTATTSASPTAQRRYLPLSITRVSEWVIFLHRASQQSISHWCCTAAQRSQPLTASRSGMLKSSRSDTTLPLRLERLK